MSNNTAPDAGASTPDDQVDEEVRAKRRNLMNKAGERLNEVSERIDMVHRGIREQLPVFVKEHSLGEAITTFIMLEECAARLETAQKAIGGLMSFIREVSMPERMDSEEMKTFTADSGDRVTRTIRLFASVMPGKQEDAFAWLRENEYGSLIKETLNSSSLSAAVKEMMENGLEPPEEIFRSHMKDGISITKGKGSKAKG